MARQVTMLAVRRLATLGLFALMATAPGRAECPFELRSYEDVDQGGFVLEIDPPPGSRQQESWAKAKILHSDRGEVLEFPVILEREPERVLFVINGRAHRAYFFDRDLHASSTPTGAHFLFIADLRSADATASSPAPLGDVLWQLTGCKE